MTGDVLLVFTGLFPEAGNMPSAREGEAVEAVLTLA